MKKVDVTSCSHSQGRSISRVMMSRMTVMSQLLAAQLRNAGVGATEQFLGRRLHPQQAAMVQRG
jgi:hypothetical protein